MIRRYQEEVTEGQTLSSKRLKHSSQEEIVSSSTLSSSIINFPLEMIDLIYSYIDGPSFLPALYGLLATCKIMYSWTLERELFQMILDRGTIMAQSEGSCKFLLNLVLKFSHNYLNSQIILNVSQISDTMISLLEKFKTVELNSCKLDAKVMYSVLNRCTSKIENLIISNCRFCSMKVDVHRDISLNLKSIKCIDTYDWVLEGMPIINIKELEIEGNSLDKIEFPNSLEKLRLRKAEYYCAHLFPQELKKLSFKSLKKLSGNEITPHCKTLELTECPISLREFKKNFVNITKLIVREVRFNSHNIEEIMKEFSMFKHVVVPESLFKLKYQSLKAIPKGKLKMLTIMRSKNHSFSKILRFRLEKLFPNACIRFKDIKESLLSCTHQFETVTDLSLLPDINSTLLKLDSIRTQMLNLRQVDRFKLQNILDAKMTSLSNILSNETKKKEELMCLELEINQMAGFKINIEDGFNNIEHAIEMYEDLIGSDEIIQEIKNNLDNAKQSNTESFLVSLKKIENDFALIRNCFEDKGLSEKFLFKNRWSSDDVVEFYSYTMNEEGETEEEQDVNLEELSEFSEMEDEEFDSTDEQNTC